MQKVITINLNGNAYQLDETAFDTLRAYLDRAERQLKDNPDRAEIMADFEQAIADKCRRFLAPQKSVVAAAEMAQIVAEMGPVDGGEEARGGQDQQKESGMGEQARTSAAAPKRLYRIEDGQMFGGVCTGLAAYFDIDVTIVRIIVLALLFVTKGAGILAYFALMFVIPYASTSEEHAAAHGDPFNAQELLDKAKRQAEEFKQRAEEFATHGEWRQHLPGHGRWRAQQRAWKRNLRRSVREQAAWARGHADWARSWGAWVPGEPGYATQVWAGMLMPILGVIGLAMFGLLAFSVYSLVTTSALFGWPLPAGIPLWAGILILFAVYHLVTSPIRAARQASRYAWGRHYGWWALWDGAFAIGATCFVIWLVYQYMPPVENLRDFMDKLPDAIRSMSADFRTWLNAVRDWFQRVGDAF